MLREPKLGPVKSSHLYNGRAGGPLQVSGCRTRFEPLRPDFMLGQGHSGANMAAGDFEMVR